MSDLISRQEAIYEIHSGIYELFDMCDDDEESPITYKDKVLLEVNKAFTERIRRLPVREVKRGRWIVDKGACEPDYMSCSFCNWITEYYGGLEEEWNFCPNCGADMREEHDTERDRHGDR